MSRLSCSLHDIFTKEVLNLLFSKKIFTVTDFLDVEVKMLSKITELPYTSLLNVRKHILNAYSANVNNGFDYLNYLMQKSVVTPSKIQSFDNLLNGGLLSGSIYELCGFSSTGKTQICLTIAANISQYYQKSVYYIDTKRDFSSLKIQNILDSRQCNEDLSGMILNRIKVKEISDQYQLISALFDIKTELINGLDCSLIIIDSLPSVFYLTGDFNKSLTIMNHFVNTMRYLSVEFNTSFVVTNIMIRDNLLNPNESSSTSIKPGLGNYWNNVPNTRVLLTKHEENLCKMTVIKSTTIECYKTCVVAMTDAGVV